MLKSNQWRRWGASAFCALALGIASAQAQEASDVEALKQRVLELNRDLLILEEELLFPANTQMSVFLSMDVGKFFTLDSVKLMVDDQLVASHLYTHQQLDALFRGGVQRLYLGNLKAGAHEISAIFVGQGPDGRDYKRGARLTIDKDEDPKVLEIRITDSTARMQPEFDIKEWDN
ncbi:AraC family transcriptional regulator [Simiduia curdlanivorans]|uniref:AraC family transcriptional regulator n=1 Tax=Simiduia curdlanivorans TaxID=1492769 RepID=A0ABV8V180_9GAMM|nr:AraC family transcriptional regulator [Simiduia curdlanivorans]MDN3638060.1 AraC family transcriptional regulator [Simiduia curdlanivorans]